jgi:NitT/TauT family transport system permease protein
MRPDRTRWVAPAAALAVLLAWEVLSRAGILSPLYFPSPATIGRSLATMAANGTLLHHGGATLFRMGIGLAAGGGAGFLTGIAMGRSTRLRDAVDPIIAAFHPIPKIAILPLVMIFFGIGETSKLIVIGLAAFFPMLISTLAGVRQIPAIHFEVAANCGAGRLAMLRRVILPASLPAVLAGLRIALNTALLVTIAVEVVSAERGLGALIWLAWEVLRVERLYATLTLIAALGIISVIGVNALARRFVPWQT